VSQGLGTGLQAASHPETAAAATAATSGQDGGGQRQVARSLDLPGDTALDWQRQEGVADDEDPQDLGDGYVDPEPFYQGVG
jgi:hypothetical protein